MDTFKFFFCLLLIIAPAIQANPATTPSVEVSAENLQIAAGESGSVTCTPRGNPLPSVQWRKHDGEFGAGTAASGNTLTIGDAQDSDGGYYECVGVLGTNVIAGKYVYVEIETSAAPPEREELKVIVSQRTLSIPRGGSGSIECTPEGTPLPSVQWIKSDGEFRAGITQTGNTLIISDARVQDRGHYVCQGIVDGTVVLTNYSAVEIGGVSQTPSASVVKLILSERQVRIPEGGNGTIECTPEGDPMPRVQWIKSDGEFRKGISQSGNTLIISDARMEDRGHYACQGIVDGTVMLTNYSAIDIERVSQRPPTRNLKLIVSERQVRIPEGGNGTIECTPEGDPMLRVQWTKSNGEFRNGIVQSGNTLIISDARMEDRGHYACQGIVDGTVMLTNYSAVDIERVSQRPPTRNLKLIVSERQVRIPEGGNGTIECTPEGDPMPRVQWIKSNGEFRNGIIQSGNTLVISDARMEDRGHYACQGIVDGTVMLTNYSAVDIERVSQRPPTRNLKLIVSERQVRIPEGGNGTIECTPEGDPIPRVQWIKSNGEFRNGIIQSGNTLVISDARMEDRGHYACQGIVDGTVMLTNYSAVDITRGPLSPPPVAPQTPPPVTQQTPRTPENPKVTVSERQFSIPLGGRRAIECTAEGNPLPTVQWLKSDGEFRAGVRQSGNTLIISDAREEDQGHYACQGIVDGTVVDTDYSKIEIENNIGITEDLPHPLEIEILEGADSRISCDFVTGDFEQNVTWTRRDQRPLPETAQEGNELIILSATKDDAGEYVCRVSASRGGFLLRTAYVRVEVLALPLVTVRPLSQTVNRGEAVTLECVVDGESQVTWERVNGLLSSRVDNQGSTLYFNGVEVEDTGYYRCSAQNKAGISSGIAQVSVNDVEPPTPSSGYLKLVVSERQLIIPRGGVGSIECTPEGNPLPKVQWIKSNGEIRDGIRQSGNTLIISDARMEDRGHYACQGIVDGTVMLTNYSAVDVRDVEPPTPSSGYLKLVVSERQLIIPRGGVGSIECTPEGNPLPKVQWIKSNGEFRDGIRQSRNTLIISDARMEDRGHYACQGIVDGTVMLTNYSAVDVRDVEPPTPSSGYLKLVVSERQLIIPRGGVGSIECTPEGNPLPKVQWIKSNGEFRDGIRQSGNTLIISDARMEDRGHYACQGIVDGTVMMTNYSAVDVRDEPQTPSPANLESSNGEVVNSAVETIESDNRPRVVAGNSRVQLNVRKLKIPEGGNGTVECSPEGSPLPTVQWHKHDGDFGVGTRQSGNALVISDAQEQDGGYYVCDGMVDGDAAWTDYLSVEIESQEPNSELVSYPRVTVNMRQLRIQRGGSIAIECTPEGNPLPTIQWSKDGGNFAASTAQRGNELVLSDAQEEDRGNYVCSAIVNGTAVFSDYLTVEIQYICELPKEVGSCRASFNRWYYDSAQHKCQKFTWGGCGGNKNNFQTEEQCSLECENLRGAAA